MKIILNKNQNVFFTSDTHFNHKNICRGTTNWVDSDDVTRNFQSLEDMDNTLIDNINNKVGEDDVLIHLGDWSFNGFENIEIFRNKINCKTIHLVLGNHDHHIRRNKDNIQKIFSSVHDYMFLDIRKENGKLVDKYNFICMHYPIASWDGMSNGIIHLHGHVHLPNNLRIGQGRSMDVGVDGNNLEPISLEEIMELMEKQPIEKLCLPKDHHVKRLI